MVATKHTFEANSEEWWAFSEEHGWVVLDKSLVENCISLNPADYTFISCRDWSCYEQGHQPWNYREAGRYLESLTPMEAMRAEKELLELQMEYREELAA